MKKLLVALLMLTMIFAFAACDNGGGDVDVTSDIQIDSDVPSSSETDLKLFDGLQDLPKYKEGGEIQYPWSDTTSGFWVSNASLNAMQKYGDKLVSAGWTLNESVVDYAADSNLYYTSADGTKAVQLKLMDETFIKVTVGAPEDVEGK